MLKTIRLIFIVLMTLSGLVRASELSNLPLTNVTVSPNSATNGLNYSLVDIVKESFHLKYPTNKITVGSVIDGYTVVELIPMQEKHKLTSGKFVTADVSEIVLKRGDRLIRLVKGHSEPITEYFVRLIENTAGTKLVLKKGDAFVNKSRKLRLLEVNEKDHSCVLEDVNTKEQFTIKQKPGRASAP